MDYYFIYNEREFISYIQVILAGHCKTLYCVQIYYSKPEIFKSFEVRNIILLQGKSIFSEKMVYAIIPKQIYFSKSIRLYVKDFNNSFRIYICSIFSYQNSFLINARISIL